MINTVMAQTAQTNTTTQASPARATGVISGKVTNDLSKAALTGAILKLEGTRFTATTNSRGEYRFASVPSGTYLLTVSYLGYDNSEVELIITDSDPIRQNFELGSAEHRLEEVVVVGTRSSLAQALNQQRAAENSATVISSDLLNSFSAETVSEALRRVSGVTFSRDPATGEGSSVSVRGFNSEAINIQLNGLSLEGTGISRGVDLSGVLAGNISSITIHKSLLPSHDSASSGGLIEIETKSGLDYDGNYFSASIENEQGFDSDFGGESEFTATGAWQVASNFGIVGTVQYRDTDRESYDVNYVGTNTPVLPAGVRFRFQIPERFNFPFDTELPDRLIVGGTYLQRERNSKNLTASINMAWDVSDNTQLRFDLQRADIDSTTTTRRTVTSFRTGSIEAPIPELGNETRRRTFVRGFAPFLSLTSVDSRNILDTLSFRGDSTFGAWEIGYGAGLSNATEERRRINVSANSETQTNIFDLIDPSNLIINLDADGNPLIVGGASFLVGDNIPIAALSPAGLAFRNNPASYRILNAGLGDATFTSKTQTVELNSRYNFSFDNIDYLEFGVKYQDNERNNSDDILSNTTINNSLFYNRRFSVNTFLTELPGVGINLQDLGLIGAGGQASPFLNISDLNALFEQLALLAVDDPNTPEDESRFTIRDNSGNPIENRSAISPSVVLEKNLAAYVQGKLVFGDLDIVGGMRFEQIDTQRSSLSTPVIRSDAGRLPRETLIAAGLVNIVDNSGTQNTLTPSLLASYRKNENLVIRLGYFRSTVNPDLRIFSAPSQVLVNLRNGEENLILREANPGIKPTEIDNLDFDIAYFFADNPGKIQLNLFYKKTSNNFSNVIIVDNNQDASVRDRIIERLAPLQTVAPEIYAELLALPAGISAILTRPENGEGGTIYGAEIDIIRQLTFWPEDWPEYLHNFSVLGNLTYTTGDFPTLITATNADGDFVTISLDRYLLGQSEWAGNASIRYDDGYFSASLIYTGQSASVSSYSAFNLNNIVPAFSTLDLRLQYLLDTPKAQFAFYLEGDNLLESAKDADIRNSVSSRFGEGSPRFTFPTSLQFNGGRTITLGVRATF
ncbi:MAG: TonB-dependent receptor [Xanthomonadales bacterium]|nr:TonB-dependent receptor [Xanthomonadales bacterium]